MDKLDQRILELIKDNARLSYSEIGKSVGISRVAVKKRMDAMENAGVIRGYRTVIDEEQAQEGIRYTIDIEALPEEYPNVVKTLQADPKLEEIYSTTGECRIHCVGRSRSKSTMEAHVNYLFNHTKGIRKVSWHILMSDLRKGCGVKKLNAGNYSICTAGWERGRGSRSTWARNSWPRRSRIWSCRCARSTACEERGCPRWASL